MVCRMRGRKEGCMMGRMRCHIGVVVKHIDANSDFLERTACFKASDPCVLRDARFVWM